MSKLPFLVVCCGNLDRGDDGAGPLVAERLRGTGIAVRRNHGEPLDLLADFDAAESVVLVDAVVTGHTAGTIIRWDAWRDRLPVSGLACSTHWIGVAEAIELARILNQLPAKCAIYGIEAGHFEPGAALTPEVAAAVDIVAGQIAEEGVYSTANVPCDPGQSH